MNTPSLAQFSAAMEPRGEWPNYHLFGDARWFLDGSATYAPWDMLIAHPPGLMSSGYSLEQYEAIMGAMLGAGLVLKHGECYTLTAKGRELNAKVSAAIAAHQQQRAAA